MIWLRAALCLWFERDLPAYEHYIEFIDGEYRDEDRRPDFLAA